MSLSESLDSEWSVISKCQVSEMGTTDSSLEIPSDPPCNETDPGNNNVDTANTAQSSSEPPISDMKISFTHQQCETPAAMGIEIRTSPAETGESDATVDSTMLMMVSLQSIPDDASDSSEVDILDEIDEEDLNNQAEQFPNFPLVRRRHSIGVMTTEEVVEKEPPKSDCLCSNYNFRGIGNTFLHRLLVYRLQFQEASARMFNSFDLLALILLVGLVFCIARIPVTQEPTFPEKLTQMEDILLKCLGHQHLDALNKGDFLHFEVCMDEDNLYTNYLTDHLLDKEALYFLSNAQIEIKQFGKVPSLKRQSCPDNEKDVDVSLIIRHLEFKNVLTPVVFGDTLQKLKESREKQIAKAAFREVLEEEKIVEQLRESMKLIAENSEYFHHSKNDDVSHQDKLHSGTDDFVGDDAKAVHYKYLVKKMENEIRDLLQEKSVPNKEDPVHVSMGIFPNSKKAKNVEDAAKFEEKLNSVLTLANNMEHLHESLSGELLKLQKWNSIIQDVADGIKDQQKNSERESKWSWDSIIPDILKNQQENPESESKWSWANIKKNTEDMVSDIKKDFKFRLDNIKKMKMSKMFYQYVEKEKNNAQSLMGSFNDFITSARLKTLQMFAKDSAADHDSKSESSGWNILKKVRRIFGNFDEAKGCFDEMPEECSIDPDEQAKSEWMFKRAADRQEDREAEVNWFLKRKKMQ